jgi:hypothetical protein
MKLTIGCDGFRLDGPESVPARSFAIVKGVTVNDGWVSIELATGMQEFLAHATKTESSAARAQTILRVLMDRLTHFREAMANPKTITGLRRSDAPSQQVAAAKLLGARDLESYRQAPFDAESLWDVVENPALPVVDRVASVIALRARGFDRSRLDAILSDTADETVIEKLRIAMTGDDRQLEQLFQPPIVDDTPLSLPERLRRKIRR